jgi:hypothetical protein
MMNNMTTKELKEMAKQLKVKNWWTLKKAELVAAIEAAQNEPESAEEVANEESIAETEETAQNDQNNGWELIAKKQLKNAYNWIVGGNENAVSDGEMTNEEFNEWIQNEALDEVYSEAITTQYHEDACGGNAPSEMRFAGRDFCYNYLKRLFKNDGYKVNEPAPAEEPTEEKKQRGKDLITYNGKTQNLSQWAKELGMPGQTLFARLRISNWPVEKAFTTPVKTRKNKAE